MNARRPSWSWLLFAHLGLMAAATMLAARGALPPVWFRPPLDKAGHLLAWGLLAFFAVAFFGRRRRWAVVGAILVAATLEEFSQRAFSTRTFDLGDLAMNAAGVCLFGGSARARVTARLIAPVCPRPAPAGRGKG
jgi:hypothetical protein